MLSFKERMSLLNKALEAHTPDTLFRKLSSFEAVGPTVVGYELKSEFGAVSMMPRNLTRKISRSFGPELDFYADNSQLDDAA